MKNCFIISDNSEAKFILSYLSKFYGKDIQMDNSPGYCILSVNDLFYKEVIEKHTEFIIKNCKSEKWWIDIYDSIIPIKVVPFMHVELPEKFKTISGNWNKYAKKLINEYVNCYESLIGQTIYYEEKPEENNIKFFIIRTNNMTKKHSKYVKKIKKYLSKQKNIFSKTVFYDIFGNNILQLC